MDDLIELLKKMGATDIEYYDALGNDESLVFKYGSYSASILAKSFNDSTAGLEVEVIPPILKEQLS